MWVTQTYLASVEPDARLFVYYMFEDYVSSQKRFTASVQRALEDLGEVFGDKVSLLMPNPRFAGRIEAEIRSNPDLWGLLRTKLPGLLISKVPLARFENDRDICVYIPFDSEHAAHVADVIQEVRRLTSDTLSWDFAKGSETKKATFGHRLLDALEIKPGIWGFKIDLKKLARQ
jgi:hypothetical protein